jgi:23S rRNA pseudouridine1911/1915/1917 synthase
MLVAKNRYIHSLFSKNELKNVQRKYLAIVHGQMNDTEGVIRAKIARKSDSIIERIVSEEGQEAITHFKVLVANRDYSVVELELETGRTHQIRVHMSSIGHPLIGDDLYGGNTDLLKRQALHSYQLSFFHPIDHMEKNFEIALPADVKSFLES